MNKTWAIECLVACFHLGLVSELASSLAEFLGDNHCLLRE